MKRKKNQSGTFGAKEEKVREKGLITGLLKFREYCPGLTSPKEEEEEEEVKFSNYTLCV